jgi:uncharacterized SAM-dependent methyltransferase
MELHALVFNELIKRGYSEKDGKKIWNIGDSKLWYLTPEQSQAYLDLDDDEAYKFGAGHAQHGELVDKHISNILSNIGEGPFNVVDLGCGSGEKAAKIINSLKNHAKIRYCPIDISGHMVEKAIETISKLNVEEITDFKYNISDFENLDNIIPLLRKGEFERSIFLLMGNTLNNFEINELLFKIRSVMHNKDMFIVDVAADDNKQEMRVKSYENSKKFNDWLIHIPLQLGLTKEDVTFKGRFENSRIEMYYVVNKKKRIEFRGKVVEFNEGDEIIVVVAYRYALEDLISYLNMSFGRVDYYCTDDNAKVLAVCKK